MRSRTSVVAGLLALVAAGAGAQQSSRVTATEAMVESEDFGMQLLGEHYRTSHARAE